MTFMFCNITAAAVCSISEILSITQHHHCEDVSMPLLWKWMELLNGTSLLWTIQCNSSWFANDQDKIFCIKV